MTLDEIENIAALLTAAGRRNVPVPISEWRTLEMSKAGEKITEGLVDAVAFARLSKLMKEKGPFDRSDDYWKGYRDGLGDARALFGKEVKVTTRIGKATVKNGKLKPIVKRSASQKAAGHKKAARTAKGLKANRERAKK